MEIPFFVILRSQVVDMFIQILKRRFFRLQTFFVILISLLLMFLSVLSGGISDIRQYVSILDGSYALLDGFPLIYSAETAERIVENMAVMCRSQFLSFYAIMYHGFHIYMLAAHIFIALPFLSFFNERKNGYTRLLVLRSDSRYFMAEAAADSVVAYLYVVIPLVIFWLIAVIIGHPVFPLSQEFSSAYDYFFQFSSEDNKIIWLYLILIFLTSLLYFFRGFFLFICSLFFEKKVLLLFVSLLYTYAFETICITLQKYSYGSHTYLTEELKSLSPFMVNCFFNLILTVILFFLFFRKERALNE